VIYFLILAKEPLPNKRAYPNGTYLLNKRLAAGMDN